MTEKSEEEKDSESKREQEKEKSERALGLPRGSVRAIIALILTGTLAVTVVTGIGAGTDAFNVLTNILLIIVGFYFGAAVAGAKTKPPPAEVKK